MICERSRDLINDAVIAEWCNAVVEHGHFHSQHEAWAVLKEEIEEMCQSINRGIFQSMLYALWIDVKADKPVNRDKLEEIKDAALQAACECVQVMAMCEKWRDISAAERQEVCWEDAQSASETVKEGDYHGNGEDEEG